MIDAAFLKAVLDSIADPVLVADTDHTVVYMNRAAVAHYSRGEKLMGTSLLDCHNEKSGEIIVEVLAALCEGEDERIITDDERHRIFMRAVRDSRGRVVGYYERYEPPRADRPKEGLDT
jgi:PAS domain-containing protein